MADPLRATSDDGRLRIAVAGQALDDLLLALRQLDRRLEHACSAGRTSTGVDASAELYRGLYISNEDVRGLPARAPCDPPFATGGREAEDHLFDSVGKYPARL